MTPSLKDMQALAEETTALLKALAHPARLMICCQLREAELSVGEIEACLGIRQPRLSRELAKLREEGLVETRREAKSIFYRLSGARPVGPVIDALCAIMTGHETGLPAPLAAARPRQPADGSGRFARIVA